LRIFNKIIYRKDREMAENRYKEYHMKTSVENHSTAAWASVSGRKDVSGVNLPDEMQIMAAKEYVDENQK
jgi:hypothetical protein